MCVHTCDDAQLAVRNDEELNKMFARVTIPDAGVMPNVREIAQPSPLLSRYEALPIQTLPVQ